MCASSKDTDSEIAELEDDILMLQRQLACEDDMRFAELNKKIVNLDSMLRTLKNENEQPAEPGVQSSKLPEEGPYEMEAIDNHNSKDIGTLKFKEGFTAQANNTVLASLVQPAGTTLEDRYVSEQEAKEYSSKPTQKRVNAVQIHDKRTSEQWVNTNMASIKAPCGIMEQEVVHTETDCTIEDTRPHLLNSERNYRSEPRKKLKREGDSDVLHNVEVAFPMPSSIPSPRIPDINKMSLVQLRALANQHNIYGVSIMPKEDLQQLLRSKLQAEPITWAIEQPPSRP
ncbi:hypothetical protein RND71_036147 [Anisodus tanguticus]|uniref:Rho termination factor N-terminal domain-containing protein n=1 Tax=Anisodus tanguticus TaxID=243964 RepID=A0AAE1V0D0_9SOLA|nr:hypothetical protein RND71_036147 [Anisodus tanguticus]